MADTEKFKWASWVELGVAAGLLVEGAIVWFSGWRDAPVGKDKWFWVAVFVVVPLIFGLVLSVWRYKVFLRRREEAGEGPE